MDQIYPDQGLLELLRRCVTPSWEYHLFVNNLTPGLGATLASLVEAAWPGYVPIIVLESAFTFSNVVGHVGSLQAANILFSNSDVVDHGAYGYYITDTARTVLIAIARFDITPVIIPAGGTLPVTPAHGDYSGLAS